jgi:serine/threonine protein kinase/Tol biopolymer transport system component
MAIGPGARIGPYEVTALLGAGGMGEVYRATDTNLARQVAIKVLPESMAADAERLARFDREAKTLAALNHPHIAAIYGLERSDGQTALVMELVEGPTLADRIADGPIPVDEALAIAKQIAEALEAAHEQGIIHRDLKPANIKLRTDGTVKILDFGLAKALEPAPGTRVEVTASPTITTPAMTGMGMILGTAAYMSPEQAKGRPADKRSDVWAFGCVLFEMLTGKRAFDGEDVSDTIAAVLRGEPDWTSLPTNAPTAVRRLVERCLEKDRRRRVADISAALFVMGEPSIMRPAAPTDVSTSASSSRSVWRRAALIAASAIAAAALTAAGMWRFRPVETPPLPVTRFAVTLGDDQRFPLVSRSILTISPDGSKIAYSANRQLWVRGLSELDARPIRGTEMGVNGIGMTDPVFSPDGASLAFMSAVRSPTAPLEITIKRVSVEGGVPVTLYRAEFIGGLSWGADGIVFADGTQRIMRVSPNGGKPEVLVTVRDDEVPGQPLMLPDGQHVLFSVAKRALSDSERWDKAHIVTQSLKSGQRTTLVEGGSHPVYVPTGHLLYANGGLLYTTRFSPTRMQVIGNPRPVIEGVRRAPAISGLFSVGAVFYAVSNTGTLIFIPGPALPTGARQDSLILVDRTGAGSPLKLQPAPFEGPRVSPDGKRIAFSTDDGKEASVWIYELSGTTAMRRLTIGGRNRFPIWTPNGDRVAFQSDREGDLGIFWQRVDGITPAERLTTAEKDAVHVPNSWSPAGDQLLFAVGKEAKFTLATVSAASKRVVPFGKVESSTPPNATFSPDGRWVAYQSGSFGNDAIFVQPFPATGAVFQISRNEDGHHPVWSRDGKELFYIPGPNQLTVRNITTSPTFAFGDPKAISRGFNEGTSPSNERNYDVTSEGKFVGIVGSVPTQAGGSTASIQVVLNWFEELNRLMPTK